MASAAITPAQTVSGNQPRDRRISETATQTFKLGVPVQLTAGSVLVWDGVTDTKGIAGISIEPASNLTTTGVAQTLTYGSVQNEPLAVNIPMGAPLNDGRVGLAVACDDTVFRGQVGPSQAVTQVNVGLEYGLTADSDGHWYVDLTDTTNKVVRIVDLDPQEALATGTRRGVFFVVIPAAQQLQA